MTYQAEPGTNNLNARMPAVSVAGILSSCSCSLISSSPVSAKFLCEITHDLRDLDLLRTYLLAAAAVKT